MKVKIKCALSVRKFRVRGRKLFEKSVPVILSLLLWVYLEKSLFAFDIVSEFRFSGARCICKHFTTNCDIFQVQRDSSQPSNENERYGTI